MGFWPSTPAIQRGNDQPYTQDPLNIQTNPATMLPTTTMKAPLSHGQHSPSVSVSKSKSSNEGARGLGFMVSLAWERNCSGATVSILPGLRRQYKNRVHGGANYPCWPDKYLAGDKFPDFQAAFPEFLAV